MLSCSCYSFLCRHNSICHKLICACSLWPGVLATDRERSRQRERALIYILLILSLQTLFCLALCYSLAYRFHGPYIHRRHRCPDHKDEVDYFNEYFKFKKSFKMTGREQWFYQPLLPLTQNVYKYCKLPMIEIHLNKGVTYHVLGGSSYFSSSTLITLVHLEPSEQCEWARDTQRQMNGLIMYYRPELRVFKLSY